MPAGFDLWDTDNKCKSCGFDGGQAHAKELHNLQMEKQALEAKLKFQDGLGSSEKENIILLPIVAKAITTVLVVITISVASCGIFGTADPPKPVSPEYSEQTLNNMKSVYEECIKDPVAMPTDCIEAMRVVSGVNKGSSL